MLGHIKILIINLCCMCLEETHINIRGKMVDCNFSKYMKDFCFEIKCYKGI